MNDLQVFMGENGLYGLKDETGEIKKEPFANDIWDDGIFIVNGKNGIINLKTGEIIKEPFADFICSDGTFKINRKWGVLDLKTGKIIKEPVELKTSFNFFLEQ